MWEKGTRVKIIGGSKNRYRGNTENHLNDTRDRFLVEFDESMGGHSGNGIYKGKRGHCWWFDYCLDKFTATDGIRIEQVKRKNNFY